MARWPDLLGGKWKLVLWLNLLRNAGKSSELKQVVGDGKLIESSDGKVLVIGLIPPKAEAKNLFNIYQSGTWLDYKVTGGYLITTGDPITVTNTETEITITTSVARYWFYLDVTATTAAVAASATTLEWDATNKIPIGWVDTDTYSAESRAVIHQREHIFVPCAI